MNKFNFYNKGSYGWDNLSKYLVVFGVIFLLRKSTIVYGIVLVGYGTWRSFSKNKYRRSRELVSFENSIVNIKQMFYKYKGDFHRAISYKVFVCPNCSQKLRVPRKQGKITVTCKRCGIKFKSKS